MRKLPLVLLGLFVALIAGRFIYGMVAAPTDEVLIKSALDEAIEGSKEGRTGSLVDLISNKFQVNGAGASINKVADLVRKSRPDVQLKSKTPVIDGNNAQITSDATITASFLGNRQTFTLHDVTLSFKKESATDWLIFPTTKWKLTDVSFSSDQIPVFGGLAGFGGL